MQVINLKFKIKEALMMNSLTVVNFIDYVDQCDEAETKKEV